MTESEDTFGAVRACAVALLGGAVLQVRGVSAGNGTVIDWRTVLCGETAQESADAFDVARSFVALVGTDAALLAVAAKGIVHALPSPRIHAYMLQANGGRLRSFDIGEFKVRVEAHEDDAAQAAFTERLAALAATLA